MRESTTVALTPCPLVEAVGLRESRAAFGPRAQGYSLCARFTPLDVAPWLGVDEVELCRGRLCNERLDSATPRDGFATDHLAPGRYEVDCAVLRHYDASESWLGPEHGLEFCGARVVEVKRDQSRQSYRLQVPPELLRGL